MFSLCGKNLFCWNMSVTFCVHQGQIKQSTLGKPILLNTQLKGLCKKKTKKNKNKKKHGLFISKRVGMRISMVPPKKLGFGIIVFAHKL